MYLKIEDRDLNSEMTNLEAILHERRIEWSKSQDLSLESYFHEGRWVSDGKHSETYKNARKRDQNNRTRGLIQIINDMKCENSCLFSKIP